MITAGDFRKGLIFKMDGEIFEVVDFQHVKPGKGAAFVRTKYRNIKTGATVERSFNPNEKYEEGEIQMKDMSYIYNEGDLYYFMDTETYEQVPVHKELIGEDALRFLKENMVCKVYSNDGSIYNVELPTFVEMAITQCDPAVKGNTAQNATKTATIETGAVIRVPLFVSSDDIIRIDTRTGEYADRVKQ